jgi:hypothetical protein
MPVKLSALSLNVPLLDTLGLTNSQVCVGVPKYLRLAYDVVIPVNDV